MSTTLAIPTVGGLLSSSTNLDETATSTSIPTDENIGGGGDDGGSSEDDGSSGGGSSPKDTPRIFVFDTPVLSREERVFLEATTKSQNFTYKYNETAIKPRTLHWMSKEAGPGGYTSIANHTFGKGLDSETPQQPGQELLSSVDAHSAILKFAQLGDEIYGQVMRLQMDWTHEESGTNGESYSGVFSVTKPDRPAGAVNQDLDKEVGTGSKNEGSDKPATLPSDSTDTNSTGTQSSPTSTGKASSSKGGLSTGAKAGIAVGVVLGVFLIVGVLAFFLIRRRRQSKGEKSGLGGQQSSGTYMVDKETHGRTTDSPNSPYSDENQTRHVNLEDLDTTRKGPSVHAEQPSFVPYEDAPGRPSMSGSRGLGDNTGAQTPTQQVSSNVAHLVEDGMTREEIERLEEEERQLDAEIERAARR